MDSFPATAYFPRIQPVSCPLFLLPNYNITALTNVLVQNRGHKNQIFMAFRLPVPARMWLVAVWLGCSLGQAISVAPLVVAPSGHW